MTVKQQCGISKSELNKRAAILVKKAWGIKYPNWQPMPKEKLTSPELDIVMDNDMLGASVAWGNIGKRIKVRL